MAVPRICSIPDCGKPHYGRGWCVQHYGRWRRYNDPLAGGWGYDAPRQYYAEVVRPYEGDDCLLWPYAKDSKGYALVGSKGDGNPTRIVSRLVCIETNGPPPTPRHEAAHSCGNGHKGCVTKRHLSWKTHRDNVADTVLHGTSNRGERCGAAKLTLEQVRTIRRVYTGKWGQQTALARQYGVNPITIFDIVSRNTWAWDIEPSSPVT